MVTLSATLVSSSLLCGISRYFWKLPLGIHIGACKPLINVIVHVTHSDPLQQSLHLSQTRLHQDQRNPQTGNINILPQGPCIFIWPCSTAPFEQEDSEDRALWRAFGPSKERWAQQRPLQITCGTDFSHGCDWTVVCGETDKHYTIILLVIDITWHDMVAALSRRSWFTSFMWSKVVSKLVNNSSISSFTLFCNVSIMVPVFLLYLFAPFLGSLQFSNWLLISDVYQKRHWCSICHIEGQTVKADLSRCCLEKPSAVHCHQCTLALCSDGCKTWTCKGFIVQ